MVKCHHQQTNSYFEFIIFHKVISITIVVLLLAIVTDLMKLMKVVGGEEDGWREANVATPLSTDHCYTFKRGIRPKVEFQCGYGI